MASSVNISGSNKETVAYVRVGNSWRLSREAWTRVNGSWKRFFLGSGVNDSSFNVNGNSGPAIKQVLVVAIQPDGKILLGIDLSTITGDSSNGIVRLNADGALDTAFMTNVGTGADGAVRTVAIQPDGKILLGGDFGTFNGVALTRMARLNANGTLDTAFNTNLGSTGNTTPNSMVVQVDGKIMVGGWFGGWTGTPADRIMRLNANGTLDSSFMSNAGTGANNIVRTVAIQPDGKILIGGDFTTFNGVTVNRIVRLNANGTLDSSFMSNAGTGANNTVNAIAIQPDGKILVGGIFTTFNGVAANRIVGLSADGTRDTAFTTNINTGFNGIVYSIAIQPDGKILVVGSFTTFRGLATRAVARLNANGTSDNAFRLNTGTGSPNTIFSVAIQSDGKILLGGSFTVFNGAIRNRIALLGADLAA
jgi:uncharacterized delta-60 repeat protein